MDLNKYNVEISIIDTEYGQHKQVRQNGSYDGPHHISWHPTQDILAVTCNNFLSNSSCIKLYKVTISEEKSIKVEEVGSILLDGYGTSKIDWHNDGQKFVCAHKSKSYSNHSQVRIYTFDKENGIKSEPEIFLENETRMPPIWTPDMKGIALNRIGDLTIYPYPKKEGEEQNPPKEAERLDLTHSIRRGKIAGAVNEYLTWRDTKHMVL